MNKDYILYDTEDKKQLILIKYNKWANHFRLARFNVLTEIPVISLTCLYE